MNSLPTTRPSVALVMLLFASAFHALALECQSFAGTTPQAALKYLQQERASLEPACIDLSIGIVRQARYAPAIETLFKYIDFRKPGGRPDIPPPARIGPTEGAYPAADALDGFGTSPVPELKKVIEDDSASKVARFNAAQVLFWITPGPSSIAFIYTAGQGAVDRDAGAALSHLAELAVPYCSKEQANDCKKAVGKP